MLSKNTSKMTNTGNSYIPRQSVESSIILDTSTINDIHQFQIILLGDIAVGKSCILRRYIDDSFIPDYYCTLAVDSNCKVQTVDNAIAKLILWDTCGEEKYRARQFYTKCDGIILVFDLTKIDTFNNLEYWFSDIEKNTQDNPVIAVVGNKNDLKEKIVINSDEFKNYMNNKDCFLYYREKEGYDN